MNYSLDLKTGKTTSRELDLKEVEKLQEFNHSFNKQISDLKELEEAEFEIKIISKLLEWGIV